MEIAIVLFIIAVIFITRSVKVVPQQNAWANTTPRWRPA